MTERERLIEDYENAYFAVLMHDLAEHEGKQLIVENEKLRNDPLFSVPKSVQMRAIKTIRNAFKREKCLSVVKCSKRLVSTAAVFFLIISALFTTAYSAVPEVRAATLNLLIKVSDVSTLLTMSSENDQDITNDFSGDDTLMGYALPNLPHGYDLLYQEAIPGQSATRYYNDSEENYICISIVSGNEHTLSIDSENAISTQQVYINGFKGLLINKNDRTCVTIADTDRGYFVSIYGSNVDDDVLIGMICDMLPLSN